MIDKAHSEKKTELFEALDKKQFFLDYQPEIDIEIGQIVAVEALIRWNHSTKGVLYPKDFISLAEEQVDIIVALGDWVLRESCRQNKAWQNQGLPPIRVVVNIANQQFMQKNFSETVLAILKETDLDPKYLEIELTENLIVNHLHELGGIEKLSHYGIKITLGDFGTENTNLDYLENLLIDRIKIDKSLIEGICNQRGDRLIAESICIIAKNRMIDIVAIGVENKEQMAVLNELNCKELQGFYFAKPQSGDSIARLLMDRNAVNILMRI